MADETPTTDAPVTEAPQEQQQEKAEVPPEVKRALSKANKEAETLRLKLREYEDRDKTEQQRLEERAAAAETRVQEVELRALRLEVAAEKGLTPAQAKRLVGTTREELEADAEELLETFAAANAPTTPRPDPSQGARSDMALNGDPLTNSLKSALGIR